MILGPTISTFSRGYFNFADPDSTPVTVYDIARGLSHLCRFAGQCPRFYSVAEHSIHVSKLVPQHLAWDALFHDCAEAFLGDVTSPLKNLLPDYQAIEARVEASLARQFGFQTPMSPEVKDADRRMLALEKVKVACNNDPWAYTEGVEVPDDIIILHMRPERAMEAFLDRVAVLELQR